MKILVPLFGLLLAACGGNTEARPEPITVVQPVAVAVDAPCVPASLGAKPDYVDTKEKLLAAQDAAERLQLLYGGRAQREARLNEIEPIVAACPRAK